MTRTAQRHRPWALLFLVLALGAAGGAIGRWLIRSLNDPNPAYLAALHAHADEAPTRDVPLVPLAPVVVALVDGLGEDAFDARLAEGALPRPPWRAALDSGVPSLSRPVYHALLTGVPQWASGIRENNYARGRADSVANRVRAAGGKVAWMLETVPWFFELFGAESDTFVQGPKVRDTATFEEVWAARPDFLVLHLTGVDTAGHAFGAASEEYLRASRDALATVRTLRALAEESRHATWFVGADHGHMPAGGHGGAEAEVRRIAWIALDDEMAAEDPLEERADVTSLAPTFARALGVPSPTESMADGLPFRERTLGPPLHADVARVAAVLAAQEEERSKPLASAAWRVALAAATLALALGAAFYAQRWRGLVAAAPALVAATAFVLAGPGLSLSFVRTHAWYLTHAGLLMFLVATATWGVARRRASPFIAVIFGAALPLAAVVASRGSLGLVEATPWETVLWPSLGLVPASVGAAILVVESAVALWPRLRRRSGLSD